MPKPPPLRPNAILGDDSFSAGGQIMAMAWSPDGSVLAVLGNHHRVLVFTADTGAVLRDHALDGLCHLAAAPSSGRVIVGNHLGIWNLDEEGVNRQCFAFEPYRGPEGWSVENMLGSADGEIVALYEQAGFHDRRARIRMVETRTGTVRATIAVDARLIGKTRSLLDRFKRGPQVILNSLALTPDGSRLLGVATVTHGSHAARHGMLFAWDCATGTLCSSSQLPADVVFMGNSGSYLNGLAVSSDGSHVATQSHVIAVSDQPTWTATNVHGKPAFLGPDSVAIATDAGLTLRGLRSAGTMASYPSPQRWFCLGMAASPAADRIAVADETRVRMFAAPVLEPLHSLQGHARPVAHLAASRNGDVLVSAEDEQLITWDVAGRRIAARQPDRVSWGIALSPDARRVLIAAAAKPRVLTVPELRPLTEFSGMVTAVAWPEQDRPLAIDHRGDDSEKGELCIRSGMDLQVSGVMPIPPSRCAPVISADGRFAVLSNDDGTAFACDLQRCIVLWEKVMDCRGLTVCGSTLIVDTGDNRGLVLMDIEVGAELGVVAFDAVDHFAVVLASSLRPRFAAALGDHRVALYDLKRTGRQVSVSRRDVDTAHRAGISSLAMSGDGGRLFVGGKDGRISIVDC